MENSQLPQHVIDIVRHFVKEGKDPSKEYHRWNEFSEQLLDELPMLHVYLDLLSSFTVRQGAAVAEMDRYLQRLSGAP